MTACGTISCPAAQQECQRERVRVRVKAEPCQADGVGGAVVVAVVEGGGGLTKGYLEIAPWPKYGSSNQSKSVCELWPPLPQTFRRIKITPILTCHILYN